MAISSKHSENQKFFSWNCMWKVCLTFNVILLLICIIFVGISAIDFFGYKNPEKGIQVLQQIDGKTELTIATAADSSRNMEKTSDVEASVDGKLASWMVDLDPRWSDFRTVLIPVIISVVITLLGSLITTYIFLKEALDRVTDQKPYAVEVISCYRKKTIKRLQKLFALTIMLTGFTAILYFLFWDENETNLCIFIGHLAWIASVVSLCILSGVFLNSCVDTESILLTEALEIEKKIKKEACTLTQEDAFREGFIRSVSGNPGVFSGQQRKENDSKMDNRRWKELCNELELEIDEREGGRFIQEKSFMFHFSALEEWLKLLANTFSDQKEDDIFSTKLIHGLNHAETLNGDVLEKSANNDLSENVFCHRLIKRFGKEKEELKGIESQHIYKMYMLLSRYRDVIRFIYETDEEECREKQMDVGGDDNILKVYYLLQKSCYLLYLRVIPKITVMQPMGKLVDIDFYGCRIEDSSFRGGVFSRAMLARIKAVNTNFDMVKFRVTSFFNGDVRNCAMSNCVFKSVDFERAGFENIDFNYSYFWNCNFRSASLKKSRFSQNTINRAILFDTDFSSSRMWDVFFLNLKGNEIRDCIFADADIMGWKIISQNNEKDYKKEIEQMKAAAKCQGESQMIEWIQELCLPPSKEGMNVADGALPRVQIAEFYNKIKKYMCSYFRWQEENQKTNEIDNQDIWLKIDCLMKLHISNSIFSGARIRNNFFFLTGFDRGIFKEAQMERLQALFLDMKGCVAIGANLKESWLIGVDLRQSNLEEVNLYQAKLSGVNLEDVNLIRAQASQSHVSSCNFGRSICSDLSLTGATVWDTSFCDAILERAEFTGSKFVRVALRRSVLEGLLSPYGEFIDCDFGEANLTGANFNFCKFRGCRFDRAVLRDVSKMGATFERCTFEGVPMEKLGEGILEAV